MSNKVWIKNMKKILNDAFEREGRNIDDSKEKENKKEC